MNAIKYIALLLCFFSTLAIGQEKESDRLKRQQKELAEKIALTQKLLESTSESRANLTDNINLIERKIHYRQALLDNLKMQLSKL